MSPSLSELQTRYSKLQDNELLQIYLESGLTDVAEDALASEVRKRGLTEQDIDNLRKYNDSIIEEQNRKIKASLKKDIKRTVYLWAAFILFAIVAYVIGI